MRISIVAFIFLAFISVNGAFAQDTIPPVITLLNPVDTIKISVGDSVEYHNTGMVVSDNESTDSALFATLEIRGTYVQRFGIGATDECGTYTLSHSITDEAKNEAEVVQWVIITKTVDPIIQFTTDPVVIVERWQKLHYWDLTYRVSDTKFDSTQLNVTFTGKDIDYNAVGKYPVVGCVTDPCGNKSCDSIMVVVVELPHSGVPEVQEVYEYGTLEIYPNPTFGLLSLFYLEEEPQLLQFQISDTRGHILSQFNRETDMLEETLDFSQLRNGIYWIRLESQDRVQVIPFMKY